MSNKKRITGITAKMVLDARGIRTQAVCADLIGVTIRQFQKYEKGAPEIKLVHYNMLLKNKS